MSQDHDGERDYAQRFPLTVITVVRSEETRVDTIDRLLGRGIRFPSGKIEMEWNTRAYPPEQRLVHDHQSIYYSLDDLEQGTGGEVIVEREV